MKHICLVVLYLFLSAEAKSKPAKLILATPETKPVAYIDSSGEITGMLVDIAGLYATAFEAELDVVFCNYPRCERLAQDGKIDLMIGLIKKQSREKVFHFVTPRITASQEQLVFFALPSVGQWHINNLAEQAIGKIRGFKLPERLTASFERNNITVFEVGTVDQLIEMLIKRRIQAFIYAESGGKLAIQQRHLEDKIIQHKTGEQETIEGFLAISRQSPYYKQSARFSDQTRAFIKNDSLPSIFKSYGLEELASSIKESH